MVTTAMSRKVARGFAIACAVVRGKAASAWRARIGAPGLAHSLTRAIFSLPPVFFRRTKFRVLFFFILMLGTGHAEGIAKKTEMAPPAYQLKSAFIYKFATFIDWPANKGKTLTLCVGVPDDAMQYFSDLAGKPVGGMKLAVRQLLPDDSAAGCGILFVASEENDNFDAWLSELDDAQVLTIGESHGWLKKGLVMRLVMQDNRVAFDVNLEAARGENIEINSRLLRLARKVYGLDTVDEPADQNAK